MPRGAARTYFVYILSSDRGVLYVGVTNDLHRRLAEHQQGLTESFTSRYKVDRLIYFEETPDVRSALERERQLKSWRREKKLALIRKANPKFEDLSAGLGSALGTLLDGRSSSLRATGIPRPAARASE